MPAKHVEPTLGAESFSCPYCGALAHQYWYKLFGDGYEKDDHPHIPTNEDLERIRADRHLEAEVKTAVIDYFQKMLSRKPFLERQQKSTYLIWQLQNCSVSKCYSCDNPAIWIHERLIFPARVYNAEPNLDLNAEIAADFTEAAKIVDVSPRGAAALLRLCIQKVCVQLNLPGKNINDDIATLVQRGLEPQLQKALDIVRVIGNDAVHPGQIDLKDDRDTALKLFGLVNIIAEAMISRPKQIEALYGSLPESKRQAIEKRDAPKLIEDRST